MNSEEIHLRDYLKVVNKHRGLITIFALVTLAVVSLGTFATTPQYLGSTSVLIEKANNNSLTDNSGFSYYDPEFYETQFQLIKSKEVAKRVVKILALESTYESYLGKRETYSTLQTAKDWLKEQKNIIQTFFKPDGEKHSDGSSTQSLLDLIAEEIREGIEVKPVKKSRIVTIEFESPNPEFATLIANTVATAYIETTLEMKMEATRRTLDWMTKKADQERLKLETTERDLQSYIRSNDLVTLENRIAVIPQKLTDVSTQLFHAQNKREKLEVLYEKVRKLKGRPEAAESILSTTSGNTLQILRDQILKAEQYIRELSTKFGAKHPTMVKAKGDLDILQNKKGQEIKRLIGSIKNQFELAVSDENNLRRQLEKTKAEAQNLNEKFIQYRVLNREMETNRQLYDALLLKMKEQSITGETKPVNLWIVDRADIPLEPFKPRTKINLLLGLIVGLFGGIGLAFFVEYLDQSIKYPDETEQLLGYPVLGLISMFKEKQGSIEAVMTEQPRSALAENYRSLRTSLLLSSADRPPKTILITSPTAGAGKSTTSINLAMAIAQSGKKVVLIDADLRKPRLHKVLGIKTGVGLSSYLAGLSKGDILQHTQQENLTFLSSGPIPPNPSDLLLSARMKDLVDKLSSDFDYVICDSPPMQSVVDGRILSQLFDGTVLVVKARLTTFDVARMVLKQLQDVHAPVLGLLINGLELKKNDYYYESYYTSYGDEPEGG